LRLKNYLIKFDLTLGESDMKKAFVTTAIALACTSPASAATYLLGGPTGTPNSVTVTPAGEASLTLTANRYSVSPALLTSTSQFGTAAPLSRSSIGLGVCTEGGNPASAGSGECPQVDANGSPNEILRASFSRVSRLQGLQLSLIDTNDTLRLYGLGADNMTLNLLGYIGTIASGTGTGFGSNYITSFVSGANGNTYNLTFLPSTPAYKTFFFTSNNDSQDGYRINSITAGAVPEPGTWAMMIGGFALAGIGLRRRRYAGRSAFA
jgi:hypothetical protein